MAGDVALKPVAVMVYVATPKVEPSATDLPAALVTVKIGMITSPPTVAVRL